MEVRHSKRANFICSCNGILLHCAACGLGIKYRAPETQRSPSLTYQISIRINSLFIRLSVRLTLCPGQGRSHGAGASSSAKGGHIPSRVATQKHQQQRMDAEIAHAAPDAITIAPQKHTEQVMFTDSERMAMQASLTSGAMMTVGDLCCQMIQQARKPPGKAPRCMRMSCQ